MGIRFRRTIKIAPGVRLNLGTRNASIRVGGRGFGVTTGTAGSHVSAGIPGTGLYATQKLSGPADSPDEPTPASLETFEPADDGSMSLEEAALHTGPRERGFAFPGWWLAGAIVFGLATLAGVFGALVLALPCAFMVWRRLSSPRYKALKTLDRAGARVGPESDEAVRAVAAENQDSWTIQRAAGLYFMAREQPDWALGYLGSALNTFPGDKRPLAVATTAAALDANRLDYAISVVEPFLATADPDQSDLDAVLVSHLALALLRTGDADRALEVVNRLPLRRRNLDEPLLLGLCVRALAKHALGKKADAARDVDRVHAADPTFAFLPEVQAAIAGTTSA